MIKKMPIRREKTLRNSLISRLFLSIPVYSCLPPEKGKALNAMQMQCECNANAMRMQRSFKPVKLSVQPTRLTEPPGKPDDGFNAHRGDLDCGRI